MKETLAVWNVKASKFPSNGTWENKLKFLVRYGILAPSGHNSQPWQFRIKDSSLEILPDWDKQRQATDPKDRELFIALGAVTKNIEVAADYFGLIFEKEYLKTSILMKFKNGKKVGENKKLFEAITLRQTNRNDFKLKKIPEGILSKLDNENLFFVEQKQEKEALADLVYGSDMVWWQTRELTLELDRWLVADVQGKTESRLPGIQIATNYFEGAKERAEKSRKLIKEAPLAIVIGSRGDTVKEWIMIGEKYEELALKLTSEKLSHSFFNAIVELESRREKLAMFCDNKIRPQLVIRVGWAETFPKHTPRRDIREVIVSSP